MAIKIRCSDCRKKISIDEAFAGGMCRCPYCKAIVYVPEESGDAAVAARPAAPGSRPAEPGESPETPQGAEGEAAAEAGAEPAPVVDHEHIPMARPVKIQGVITIVLLALLLVMVGLGVAMALLYIPSGPLDVDVPDEGMPVNPLSVVKGAPAVAGLKLQASPVIYILDGGSSMRDVFDGVRVMVGNSVASLGAKNQFTAVLCREDEDKFMGAAYANGGEEGKKALHAFLDLVVPTGASDIPRALKAAVERKCKVIVLVARKTVDDAAEIAAQAKAQGIVINTISVDGDSEVNASMKALAAAGGGEAKAYYSGEF